MSANIDYVVGIEARGYMLGAPVAYALGAGFVPVRKPGKLPGKKFTEEYALEYGTNTLEIHADAVDRGKRVLVIDDCWRPAGRWPRPCGCSSGWAPRSSAWRC